MDRVRPRWSRGERVDVAQRLRRATPLRLARYVGSLGPQCAGALILRTYARSLFAVPTWQRGLGNPALLFLSAISYNLYLWHQVVARALRDAHVPPWAGANEHADSAWGLTATGVSFAVAIVVAWALTHFVERPLLRARPFEAALTRPPFQAERV